MTGGAGPRIAGYEILRELGRGGFATVYEARQLSVDRLVALKVVSLTGIGADVERRFRAEIRTIGSLSWHPNVVALHDAGISETGLPFLAMELIDGGSWGERVSRGGPSPASKVLEVGTQVAEALAAAHAAGIIHRDVKPDNVLVGRLGEAMLADFGIATLTDGSASVSSTFVGTLAYSAPELLEGARADARADVYSTAATLYTLAAGRAAYHAEEHESPAALIYRVASVPPEPLPSTVPRPLVEVIEQGMARAPGDRPPTAKALVEALQEAQRALSGPSVVDHVDRRSTIAYREGGPTPGHPEGSPPATPAPGIRSRFRPPPPAGSGSAPTPSGPATPAAPAGPRTPPAALPPPAAAASDDGSALGLIASFPPRPASPATSPADDPRPPPPAPDLRSLPPPPSDPGLRRPDPYDPPPRPVTPTPAPAPAVATPPSTGREARAATPPGVWASTIRTLVAGICCAPVGLLFAIGAHRRLLAGGGRLRDKDPKGRWVVVFAYLWAGLALGAVIGVTAWSFFSARSTTGRYAGTWEGRLTDDPTTEVTLTLDQEQAGLGLSGTLITQGGRGCLARVTDASSDGGDVTLTLEGRCEDGDVLRQVVARRSGDSDTVVLGGDLTAELQQAS